MNTALDTRMQTGILTAAKRWAPITVACMLGCIVYTVLALRQVSPWTLITVGVGLLAGPLIALATLRQLKRRTYIVPIEPPLPPRDFQGREDEISQILEAITTWAGTGPAVVGISGATGIGKTALATQFAHIQRQHFPGGQLFARLDHRTGEESPAEAILRRFANALILPGEKTIEDAETVYATRTAERRVLIVIDNVCHTACAKRLLPAGAKSAAIVTFTPPLDGSFPGVELALSPLPGPVALTILESAVGAGRVRENQDAAVRIAKSGHPLAVRLAATALNSHPYWSLGRAVARMDEVQQSRINDALITGLDLSYALLTKEERRAVRCLGLLDKQIFAPWELAAVLMIEGSDAIRIADNLAHAQFLRRTSGGQAGVVEFSMHERVLEYATERMQAETRLAERRERLNALAQARNNRRWRVGGLILELNDRIPKLKDSGQLTEALDASRAVLLSARECRETEGEALALATLADIQVELGNTDDAHELADAACALLPSREPVRALRALGKVMRRRRDFDRAQEYLARAVTEAQRTSDLSEEIRTLIERSAVLAHTEDKARSVAVADEAVRICEHHQDKFQLLPWCLWARGNALFYGGDVVTALDCLSEASLRAGQTQTLWSAWIDWSRGRAALRLKDYTGATRFATEALDHFGGMAHRFGVAYCRLLLGRIYATDPSRLSRLDEAVALLTDALETFQNCSDPWTEADARRTLGSVLVKQDDRRRGIRLLQEAASTFEGIGDQKRVDKVLDELRSARRYTALPRLSTNQLHDDRSAGQRQAS